MLQALFSMNLRWRLHILDRDKLQLFLRKRRSTITNLRVTATTLQEKYRNCKNRLKWIMREPDFVSYDISNFWRLSSNFKNISIGNFQTSRSSCLHVVRKMSTLYRFIYIIFYRFLENCKAFTAGE